MCDDETNKKLIEAIVSYGNQYCLKYLAEYDSDSLESDWWPAFDFFLARACSQGRSEEMCQRVYEKAREVLSPLFSIAQKDQIYQFQKQRDWNDVRTELEARIGKWKVGKARDVEMIICALKFIDAIPSKNIVAYSVSQIRAGQVQEHYHQLQAQVTTCHQRFLVTGCLHDFPERNVIPLKA